MMNMMTMMLPPKKQYKASAAAKEYYDGSLYPLFLLFFPFAMGIFGVWLLSDIRKLGKYLYYGVCC